MEYKELSMAEAIIEEPNIGPTHRFQEHDGVKYCPKCHLVKPVSCFASHARGHKTYCKDCDEKANKPPMDQPNAVTDPVERVYPNVVEVDPLPTAPATSASKPIIRVPAGYVVIANADGSYDVVEDAMTLFEALGDAEKSRFLLAHVNELHKILSK